MAKQTVIEIKSPLTVQIVGASMYSGSDSYTLYMQGRIVIPVFNDKKKIIDMSQKNEFNGTQPFKTSINVKRDMDPVIKAKVGTKIESIYDGLGFDLQDIQEPMNIGDFETALSKLAKEITSQVKEDKLLYLCCTGCTTQEKTEIDPKTGGVSFFNGFLTIQYINLEATNALWFKLYESEFVVDETEAV
jgi:hypothetical protein